MRSPNFPEGAPPTSGRVETRRRAEPLAAAGRGAGASGFPGRPAAGGGVAPLPRVARGGRLFRKKADEAGAGGGAGGGAGKGQASADAPAAELGLREIGQGEADAGIALPAKRDRGAGGWPSATCRGAGAEDAGTSAPGFGDGLATGSSGKVRPNGVRGGSSCRKREGRKMESGAGARRGLAWAGAAAGGGALREIGPGKAESGSARPKNGGTAAGGWPPAACRGPASGLASGLAGGLAGEGAGASAREAQDGLAAGGAPEPLPRAGRFGWGKVGSGAVAGRGAALGEGAAREGAAREAAPGGGALREMGPGGAEAGRDLAGRLLAGRAPAGTGSRDAGGRAARRGAGRRARARGGRAGPGGAASAARAGGG